MPDQPEDRWSDGNTPPSGEVQKTDQPRPRRRALRLAAAIGIIVGGLCIVLGTLALVVELGPHNSGKHQPTARLTATFKGHGNKHPRRILIPGPGQYEVAWSFSCPPGRTGGFKMAESRAAVAGNAEVKYPGRRGSGTWLDPRTARKRTLFIVTDCNWHVNAVPASSATPSPGRGDQHKTLVSHAHKKHHGRKAHPHKKQHRHVPEHPRSPGATRRPT